MFSLVPIHVQLFLGQIFYSHNNYEEGDLDDISFVDPPIENRQTTEHYFEIDPNNLKKVQDANKEIAKLLANTDIIKNSLANPKASEEKINEQVDLFFGAITCVTGNDCVQQSP